MTHCLLSLTIKRRRFGSVKVLFLVINVYFDLLLPLMEKVKQILANSSRFAQEVNFDVGDVIEVVYEDSSGRWKVRKFTGICISLVKRSGFLRLTLRNVFNNIPVEMAFDLQSPLVISVTKTPLFKKTSRLRSKLFYLRRRRISDSRV